MLAFIFALVAVVLVVAGVLGLLHVLAVPGVLLIVLGLAVGIVAWLVSGRGPRDVI